MAGMDLRVDRDVLPRWANAEKGQIEAAGEGGAQDGLSFLVLRLISASKPSIENLELISLRSRQHGKLSHMDGIFTHMWLASKPQKPSPFPWILGRRGTRNWGRMFWNKA